MMKVEVCDTVSGLYRHINSLVRQLDEYRSHAKSFEDLFSTKLYNQRSKLRNYCEKVMFHNTNASSVQIEELMWQKIFYDIIATGKKMKSHLTLKECLLLNSHINSAIGFYNHLLINFFYTSLQLIDSGNVSKNDDNQQIVDDQVLNFALNCNQLEFQDEEFVVNRSFVIGVNEAYLEKIRYFIYRSLLILGDLNRYKTEFFPETSAKEVAIDLYIKATDYAPEYGMPYNQIASLVSKSKNSLDSTYFYLRSLSCKNIFQGTENNLLALFEKKRLELISLKTPKNNAEFISSFLTKFQVWVLKMYFSQNPESVSKLNANGVDRVDPDIVEVLKDFETCLDFGRNTTTKTVTGLNESKQIDCLTDEIILKTVAIAMFVMQGLKTKNVAIDDFLFRIFDKLIKRLTHNKQQIGTINNEENDYNDELGSVSEDSDNEEKDQDYLKVIKILLDWFSNQSDFWKQINHLDFSKRFSQLLNSLKISSSVSKLTNNEIKQIPLSEDFLVKDLEFLQICQKDIKWNYYKMNSVTFTINFDNNVRCLKLIKIGKDIVNQSLINSMSFDRFLGEFVVIEKLNSNKTDNVKTSSNKQLMKNMGQLWLQAEIKQLENLVKQSSFFSPFLILETNALFNNFDLVKDIVATRRFVIIVPNTVLSILDDLKLESNNARVIIRYLENSLQYGNRFIRAQRSHEKLPLPLLKCPKRKTKNYLHSNGIFECCHYFAKQKDVNSSMVTLLYDRINNSEIAALHLKPPEISLIPLVETIDVHAELITVFYGNLNIIKPRKK